MYYSGIDLHKDNSFITTINDGGGLVKQERVRNTPESIRAYFGSIGAHPREHRAVVESTSSWYWLSDLLEEEGIDLTLAHAKYLKAIAYAKVKTDKVDSQTLASLLRMDLIAPAHKISKELRALRDMMRQRLRLVQKRTSCYNMIHRMAEKFNLDEQVDLDHQVIPVLLPPLYQVQMQSLYEQVALLNNQIKRIEHQVYDHLVVNDQVRLLLMLPAFGLITSFSVYLEIDGIERFPSERQFFSYCRVAPGAKNSNKTQRHKSGCKDGNKYLKIALTDAAVHAVRYYPEVRALYQKVLRRSNQAIARTVVAKELARIVYYVLKTNEPYRGFKGQAPSRHKQLPKARRPRPASPAIVTGAPTATQTAKPQN